MPSKIDLVGKTFGSWIVLADSGLKGRISWICKCSCGRQATILGSNLTCGRSKRCRDCGYKSSSENSALKLSGQVFGSLTVLRPLGVVKHKGMWLCKCLCGAEYEAIGTNLVVGKTTRCLKCAYDMAAEHHKDGELSKGTWCSIRNNALDRSIELSISRQDALEVFIAQNRKCALTGIDLKLKRDKLEPRSSVTASLDRIDSSLPYRKDNIQWVHKAVNLMKRDFDEQYFISWCHRISDFAKEKNNVF